ncbi:MAG: T9SS type A sorting domain-containing protein [Chitinophagaceae bacterium]|nr:T9SS type A sorting domain-containing protein [Chitinophagaceae bacterium]
MLLLLFCLPVFSQTNISGVVNTYYGVTEVIPSKACVRLNTVTGLSNGDKAMLVQMKGVTINTTNTVSFGDTSALNNAGNYEIGDICYIRGDSVFFVYMLLNAYAAADKVQLVRVPEYVSATVVDTLKAAPWNNTTGTGGVLAIFVEQDLVLNAPVYGDTYGYRGGAYIVSSGTCSDIAPANGYYYSGSATSPQSGSYKGEGAADVAASQSGGRGAPANGGGGGNNHNNGGAGGANLTAGGIGGGNSSTTGCTAMRQGLAGKALSSHSGKKIFMGGGGGAGHVNNNLIASNGGGHGGGIVFIRANNMTGNGHKISANGQVGGPALSDGASGAGAGGTIIMHVNNYIGPATVEAIGGTGGTEDDGGNIRRCYGAGGGGSGGVIYFSGTTPAITVTVTGGAAGSELGRDALCSPAVLPGAGAVGQIIPNYTYSSSSILSNSYCSILLPVNLAFFKASYANGNVLLKWKTLQPETIQFFSIERSPDGNNWTAVFTRDAVEQIHDYSHIDPAPATGYNFYRIRITKKNNAVIYSSVQKVYVPTKNETVHIYPNPAGNRITITGVRHGSSLSLLDISGKLVFQKRVITSQRSVVLELPHLPSGVYVMMVDGTAKQLAIH